MPYGSVNDIPAHARKHGEKMARRWKNVFNSVYSAQKSKGKNNKEAETRAFKAANSILPS